MKKAKTTKVTKTINNDGSAKLDNYGNYSFIIELDNGDKGFYSCKKEDQSKFVVGQDVEYNIEEKTGGTGKKYNKISIPQTEGAKSFGGGRPQQDPKVQMISFSMSYAKDLIVGGKVGIDDLEKTFNKIHSLMISKL